MAMSMRRAFNAKMKTRLIHHTVATGSFDADNDWTDGTTSQSSFAAVIKTGNKFSQLEEGISIDAMPGGERSRDFMSLYLLDEQAISLDDYIQYKGKYYRVLRLSDESTYGFDSYLLEKSKNWSPNEI